MALVVGEDTYISVADADTYWQARQESTWTDAAQAAKEAALLEATQYVDKGYRWVGRHPGSPGQLLAWPRLGAYDAEGRLRTGIPTEVAHATAELALQALNGRLMPVQERGGQISSVKIGPLAVDYGDGSVRQPAYDFVRHMLRPLVRAGGRRLERT